MSRYEHRSASRIHAPGCAEGVGIRRAPTSSVTAHAMVRWLERAEGRDLGVLRAACSRVNGLDRDPTDGELLQFLADYTGEQLVSIRARMLTANVVSAIDLGASRVRVGRVFLVIEDGHIVTVQRRRRVLHVGPPPAGRFRSSKGRAQMRPWIDGGYL